MARWSAGRRWNWVSPRRGSTASPVVGLRNVHHLGRIGAWGEICARAGFVSIHYVNAHGHDAIVAPFGGYDARYSTNPYCTALPATPENPMLVLDMATSRVAQGKVRVAHYREALMAEGILVGPDGEPDHRSGRDVRRAQGRDPFLWRAQGLRPGADLPTSWPAR